MCMTCVSGFFVDLKADDMISAKSVVAPPVFPRPSAYMYTDCKLQSVPRLSEESQLHIFSFTAQKKQSQSWRTESLQGSSGINRFDLYWKEKSLWEGGLWDITIAEEAKGLCRSGSPERILADLAVMVRERFMLLVSLWGCMSGSPCVFISIISLPEKCEEHTLSFQERGLVVCSKGALIKPLWIPAQQQTANTHS